MRFIDPHRDPWRTVGGDASRAGFEPSHFHFTARANAPRSTAWTWRIVDGARFDSFVNRS